MVSFIMETISNRHFMLYISDGKASRPRTLKNGMPQGSILAPCLFNIYISNMPKLNPNSLLMQMNLRFCAANPPGAVQKP